MASDNMLSRNLDQPSDSDSESGRSGGSDIFAGVATGKDAKDALLMPPPQSPQPKSSAVAAGEPRGVSYVIGFVG